MASEKGFLAASRLYGHTASMNDEGKSYELYTSFLFSIVTRFTNIEYLARALLKQKSGLRQDYFDAILGLPKLNSVVSGLTKLYKIEPDPEHQEKILSAFEQLTSISRLRNWMVHAGGNPVEGDRYLVRLNPNERSISTGEALHYFRDDAFIGATADLDVITMVLIVALGNSAGNPHFFDDHIPWKFKLPGIERG